MPTGTKTFVFVSRFPGSRNTTRRMIGDTAEMSLAVAREPIGQARQMNEP